MIGSAGCCARTASGQVAALLPTNIQAQYLRGLEIDNQIEIDWRLDGQLARFRTLEDAISIGRCTPKLIECARSVGHQAPDFGEDTERIDSRDTIAISQRSDVRVVADREGVRHYDEATIWLTRRCGDNTFKLGHTIN